MVDPRHWQKIAGLIGLAATLLAAPVWVHAADKGGSCKPLRSWGQGRILEGCEFSGDTSDPVTTVRRFVDAHAGELGMLQGGAELEHVETTQGLAGQHVRFQQVLGGYPVYGAFVSAFQDRKGGVRRLSSSYNAARKFAVAAKRSMTREEADQIARQAVGREAGAPTQALLVKSARQVWFPRTDGRLTLAWELAIAAERPLVNFRSVVDAYTGQVLVQQNRLVSYDVGRGLAFLPNPIQSSGDPTLSDGSDPALIDGQRVLVDIMRLESGTGLLKGRFVDVIDTLYPRADEPATRQYLYEAGDPRLAQVNAYFAIDSVQRYLRALGYDDDRTVPNGIRSSPTVVDAHANSADNSNYSPPPAGDDSIRLGDGGIPDAEDADIVVHEYGHAIQHAQNKDWGCPFGSSWCETSAMGEGFSDYLAASFHAGFGNPAYQQANAACVGEWNSRGFVDKVTGQPAPRPCLRRVDGNKIYPDSIVGEVHKDGEIWSRALWDIRAAIRQGVTNGGSVADQIILEHHFPTWLVASDPNEGPTMPDAAQAMIAVDDQLFGGVNDAALRTAFCARNILTGSNCTPSSGTKTVYYVTKDTFIRQSAKDRNDGASPRLAVRGSPGSRTQLLLWFDGLSGIDPATVKSVVLEMAIEYADVNWGRFGRTIDVHPLTIDFAEGNGVGSGAPEASKTPGSGPGATWNCSSVVDLSVTPPVCSSPGVVWKGGHALDTIFGSGSDIPPVVQTSGTTGRARWAVTDDVKAGVKGWVVKTTFPDPGSVFYYSKEGAVAANDPSLAPRLIVTFKN